MDPAPTPFELARALAARAAAASSLSFPPASAPSAPPPTVTALPPQVLIVANRLPVTLSVGPGGGYTFTQSSGGLVSALSAVRSESGKNYPWIGWLGRSVPPEDEAAIRTRLLEEHNCVPVFLEDALASQFYDGMCNDLLWPMLHHGWDPCGAVPFAWPLWEAYKRVNERFAEVILETAKGTPSACWLHDYHLMHLPTLLSPAMSCSFFLHTPWPSPDIWSCLPVSRALMESLLKCDLLGFHTPAYASHFVAAAARVPGAQPLPDAVTLHGHSSTIGVFPIGIEAAPFEELVVSPACLERQAELVKGLPRGGKTVVSVDRLDPIKGIPHRLLALEALFRRWPEWVGRLRFIQVAVPSRGDVPAYAQLAAAVAQLVGRINGRYGTTDYLPITYLHRSIPPLELAALYAVGDVLMVSSLRDGQNLVAYEQIACQVRPPPSAAVLPADLVPSEKDGPGVLLLSEFAGCAQSLAGSMRIHPFAPDECADVLHAALTLPSAERMRRWQLLHAAVTTFSARQWADRFVSAMMRTGAP